MAPFEEGLLALLPGESKDDVVVRARNTNAQNVTNQVRDIDARLAQLSNYRDRMMELSKRGGAKTDDLIKIEGEISRTQSEIEQIEGQRRDLAERIAKENLSISFEAQSTVSDAFQPVRDVWQESLRVMGNSAAAALGLIVAIIPWIPLFLRRVLPGPLALAPAAKRSRSAWPTINAGSTPIAGCRRRGGSAR